MCFLFFPLMDFLPLGFIGTFADSTMDNHHHLPMSTLNPCPSLADVPGLIASLLAQLKAVGKHLTPLLLNPSTATAVLHFGLDLERHLPTGYDYMSKWYLVMDLPISQWLSQQKYHMYDNMTQSYGVHHLVATNFE